MSNEADHLTESMTQLSVRDDKSTLHKRVVTNNHTHSHVESKITIRLERERTKETGHEKSLNTRKIESDREIDSSSKGNMPSKSCGAKSTDDTTEILYNRKEQSRDVTTEILYNRKEQSRVLSMNKTASTAEKNNEMLPSKRKERVTKTMQQKTKHRKNRNAYGKRRPIERCFGWFRCHECKAEWTSAYTWRIKDTFRVVFKQKCQICKEFYFPYKNRYLECPICGNPVPDCQCTEEDFQNYDEPEKPHRSDLCQKCLQSVPCRMAKRYR